MSMDNDLIALVNKLQDTFNAIGGDAVDLPQIVVVGSQSSGKSSVLETIVGKDFLPRGSGIVTRRPLVLQLIHTPGPSTSTLPVSSSASLRKSPRIGGGLENGYLPDLENPSPSHSGGGSRMGASTGTEYAEFLHINRRFTDFEEIRKEIEAETYRVAGQNKGVSKLPINLKIYGPGVLNLTLVDLPGLTKVPVGDQPTDIERQIKNLVVDYISKPNSVILAVSPANVDLANSDALKLARTVDPRGLRTLGVLTKLDLMDAGTNALDVLTGRTYPLKLGFVGVVNRSQQDIMTDLPMEDARRKEEDFFKHHPVYRNLAHRCGTKFLAKTLNHVSDSSNDDGEKLTSGNQVLMNHIRDKLPDMKARLNTLMGQTQQELNAFGDATFLGEQHRGSLILKLMTEFSKDFVSSIEGTSLEISTKELCGGARIYYIFNEVFGSALQSIDPTHNLSLSDIRTAIRNSTGPRPSLFVPEVAFDLLVKPQIKLLEAPSLRCVELVYEELMKICHNCTNNELQRFPRLHAQLVEVVSELLRERLGPTSEYASSLISIQAAYINTNHPEFVAGSAAIAREGAVRPAPVQESSVPSSANDDEDLSSSDNDGSAPPNAALLPNHHPQRSASVSITEKSRPAPPTNRRIEGKKERNHHRAASGGANSQPIQNHSLHPGHPTSVGGSPHTAKETFLNYFFGGPNGAGPQAPITGAERERGKRAPPQSFTPREILPDLGTRRAGSRNGLEGGNTAFDMKSLGKHIETVSGECLEEVVPSLMDWIHSEPVGPAHPLDAARGDGDELDTESDCFVLWDRATDDPGPDPESDHALAGTSSAGGIRVLCADGSLQVNFSRDAIQQRLVTSLYKPDLFAELLFEDEALVTERTRVKALLDAYKEAFRVLSEVSLKSS
ncbi:dynamin 1-like protein, partial [Tremellales sp. Uapishka_1]